jgi:hypothetical protein
MMALRVLLAGTSALLGVLLIVPIIIISLFFTGFKLLTQVICYLIEPRFKSWTELIEFDPRVGWKPMAHLDTYHLADDVFHMTTDAQGWHGKAMLAECDIVVFGDSFASGYGVDDAKFFANLNPELHIKCIGTNGYNMVQELLWMQQLAPQLKGKLVVWFVYFGNDLYENLIPDMCGYRAPFVRALNGTDEWEIVGDHITPTKWFYASNLHTRTLERDYYGKLAAMCGSTFLSQRAFAACEYLISKGRDLCNQVGAILVVMTIPDATQLSVEGVQFLQARAGNPDSFNPDYPDEQMSGICQKLDVHYIALKDYLDRSHYKERDCHWNEAGHRQLAKILTYLYHSRFRDTIPRIIDCPSQVGIL